MSDIVSRTFDFATPIVKLCQYLDQRPGCARTLSRQLLRAGTSIGANVGEAQAGQSRADFISKYAIASKEARETHYWLRLIAAAEILPAERLLGLQTEADELGRILASTIVSAKTRP